MYLAKGISMAILCAFLPSYASALSLLSYGLLAFFVLEMTINRAVAIQPGVNLLSLPVLVTISQK
jgi:hypothetical protein